MIRIILAASLAATLALAQTAPSPKLQTAHYQPILDLAYSPDGAYFATASVDRVAKLWHAPTGYELATYAGAEREATSVVFAPDGKNLLVGYADGAVHALDPETFAVRWRENAFEFGSTNRLFVSSDLRYVLATSDAEAKLLELETGAEWRTLGYGYRHIIGGGFSADDETVFIAGGLGVSAIDAHNGRIVWSHNADAEVLAFAVSEEGEPAIGNLIGEILLLDEKTGEETKRIQTEHKRILDVAFFPEGDRIAVSGMNGVASVYDLATGERAQTFSWRGVPLAKIVVSPDASRVLGAGYYGAGAEYNLLLDRVERELIPTTTEVHALSFSPDGESLAQTGGYGGARLWDFQTGGPRVVPARSYVADVAFVGEDSLLVSAAREPATLYDARTMEPLGETPLGVGAYLAGSPARAAAGMTDDVCRVYDFARGEIVAEFEATPPDWTGPSLSLSDDGTTLAFVNDLERLVVRDLVGDVETVLVPHDVPGYWGTPTALALAPDGGTLAQGDDDGMIAVWSVAEGTMLGVVDTQALDGAITRLAFSPSGKRLAAGTATGATTIFNLDGSAGARTELGKLDGACLSLAWSPDETRLAAGSREARLFDVGDGELEATLAALDTTNWAAILPDGRFDASPDGARSVHFVAGRTPLPIVSLFDRYYAPGILASLFADALPKFRHALDLDALAVAAPKATIFSPAHNGSRKHKEALVQAEIVDRGGGVGTARGYVNGKLVAEERFDAEPNEGATYSFVFETTLATGWNEVEIVAANRDQTESTPAEASVFVEGPTPKSKLFVVVVGVNDYENDRYDLRYAVADAKGVGEALAEGGAGIFSDVIVHTALDADARRENVLAAFDRVAEEARPEDAFVFYYSGHGAVTTPEEGAPAEFFLALQDVRQIYGDDDELAARGVSAAELRERCRAVPATKQALIIDACHAGEALGAFAERGAAEEKAIHQLARNAGVFVVAASGPDQSAKEIPELGHGAFTFALIEGLRRRADEGDGDGIVTARELETFVAEETPKITERHNATAQTPMSWTFKRDFPLTVILTR
jgi:WD40 repeat protein